jgi:hypothetical protein
MLPENLTLRKKIWDLARFVSKKVFFNFSGEHFVMVENNK